MPAFSKMQSIHPRGKASLPELSQACKELPRAAAETRTVQSGLGRGGDCLWEPREKDRQADGSWAALRDGEWGAGLGHSSQGLRA